MENSLVHSFKFVSFLEEILQQVEHLLDDVSDEFSQYRQIKILFEQWKSQYNESYTDAFIEICLPKVFAPLIRREMIDWIPLEVRHQLRRTYVMELSFPRRYLDRLKIIHGINNYYSMEFEMDEMKMKIFH